jgi:hypothetical protein
MDVLCFSAPEHADFLPAEEAHLVSPTIAQLIAFLRRGAEYWGERSGSGSLRWCKQEPRKEGGFTFQRLQHRPGLSILYHHGVGFHFAYSTGKRGGYLVPYQASLPAERIVHPLGGQRAYFPVATFVSLETAERIVTDFMNTGEASSAVAWEAGAKLRCGDPDS